MPDALADFWQQACAQAPALAGVTRYKSRGFGADPRLSGLVLAAIRSGEKTGTFAVDWEFAARPGDRPAPGDHYVVVDHAGQPALVIRITATGVVPFDRITDEHIAVEGRALRELEPWRRLHWDYWTHTLAAIGRAPAADMPVLWQRFELVYAP